MLTDADAGFAFEAEVDAASAKYIGEGDSVVLHLNGGKDTLDNLKIDSMYASAENNGKYRISVLIPPGKGAIGTEAVLDVHKQSAKFNTVIPMAAIHQEGLSTYVLVIATEQTVLGEETVVERIDVIIEDKNSESAAVGGGLTGDHQIVTESNKALQTGDRVRLTD